MSTPDLSAPVRDAIFDALRAMAWADGKLDREEILAMQAAGRVLAIQEDVLDALDRGPPVLEALDVEPLDEGDRELVYICAAWFALVDEYEHPVEQGLLEKLRGVLALEAEVAEGLHRRARRLYAQTPASVPWWKELEGLIEASQA